MEINIGTKYSDYDRWILAVKSQGAEKILEEYNAGTYPNFIYATTLGNERIVGHWRPESNLGDLYSKPMKFFTARRKFREVRLVESKGWVFKSSKGDKEYEVTQDGVKLQCTCPGYTFRRKCKHVTEIKAKLESE